MLIIHPERVTEKAEFRPGTRDRRDCEDVESILDVLKLVLREVCICGTNHALLLLKTDRIFRRFGVLTCFDLYERKYIPFPGDHVDFSSVDTEAGRHDAIPKRSEMVDGIDFGTTSKGQQPVKKQRKRHTTFALEQECWR